MPPPCLQAAKQPHGDLSGAEVEGSVRSVEHLLWLTQHSRAVLGAAGQQYGQLSALHAALCTLAGTPAAAGAQAAQAAAASPVPPQARCWAWLQQQRSSLAALVQQAEETAELLEAAAAAETAAAPRSKLQAGSQQAAAAAAGLRECSSRLGAASQQAVQLCAADSSAAGAPLFLPAAVLAALQASAAALQAVEEQLRSAAVQQEEQQEVLPGWHDLVAAVAAACQEAAAAQASLWASSEPAAPAQQQEQQLAASLEAAIAAALVWAQNAKPAEAAAAADGQAEQEEAEQPPLPALLQQLEQRLCLPKAAELASHAGAVLAAVAAASNLPRSEAAAAQQQQLAAAAAGLAPLLGLLLAALRQLGLQYLALHKAAAKLCYICASLFAGLVQEGFCMPEGTEGAAQAPDVWLCTVALALVHRLMIDDAAHGSFLPQYHHLPCAADAASPNAGEAEEGGEGKTTEGTGLGEGDTTGAKDISNEVGGGLQGGVGGVAGGRLCQPAATRPCVGCDDGMRIFHHTLPCSCLPELAVHPAIQPVCPAPPAPTPPLARLQLEDQDQLLGAKQKGAEEEEQQEGDQGPQEEQQKQEQGAHQSGEACHFLCVGTVPWVAGCQCKPGHNAHRYGRPPCGRHHMMSKTGAGTRAADSASTCSDHFPRSHPCQQVWRWTTTLRAPSMMWRPTSSSQVSN